MRYYFNSEIEPTSLKQALEKVKGVEKVELTANTRLVNVTWSGKCRDLGSLENTAAAVGVPAMVISHAHVYLAFKPAKGASLETLNKELAAIQGVKGMQVSGAAAELHADLQAVTIEAIRAAAKAANFDAQLKSHQWVEAPVASGDAAKVQREFENTRGVLVMKSNGPKLGFWAVKGLTEAALKKGAEKVGAALGDIQYP